MFIGVWADGQFMDGKWVSGRPSGWRGVLVTRTLIAPRAVGAYMASKDRCWHMLNSIASFVWLACHAEGLRTVLQVHQDGTTFKGSFDKSIPVR